MGSGLHQQIRLHEQNSHQKIAFKHQAYIFSGRTISGVRLEIPITTPTAFLMLFKKTNFHIFLNE